MSSSADAARSNMIKRIKERSEIRQDESGPMLQQHALQRNPYQQQRSPYNPYQIIASDLVPQPYRQFLDPLNQHAMAQSHVHKEHPARSAEEARARMIARRVARTQSHNAGKHVASTTRHDGVIRHG